MYSKLHEQTMNLNNVRNVRIGVQIRYNHVDDNFNSSNVLPTFFFLVRNHIFKRLGLKSTARPGVQALY